MSAAEVTVIDKDGEWFVNTAMFRFVHGAREGETVIFESHVPTRIRPDDWIKSQPLIVSIADPFGELPPVVTAETPIDGGKSLKDPATIGIEKVEVKLDEKAEVKLDEKAGGDAKK